MEYGHYKINSINLAQKVGVIDLTHIPEDDSNNASKDTDFGAMKIEFLSDSALKDIQVQFLKDGTSKVGNATCGTD